MAGTAAADPVAPQAQEAQPAQEVPFNLDGQNVDQLIETMDRLSREAEAHDEQLKQLEGDISKKEDEIKGLHEQSAQAKAKADEASKAVDEARADVDKLAQTRYRGAQTDPLTAVIAAKNPQNAIDRSAYMSAYTRMTEEKLNDLSEAVKGASEAFSKSQSAEAAANFQAGQLKASLEEKQKKEADFKDKMQQVKDRVEKLDGDARQRWIQKNGPLPVTAKDLSASALGNGAVGAAMSKLGSPYGWGSAGPTEFDCSGLMYWAFQQQGKTIPRTSQAQMSGGAPVSRDQLQPGDIVGYYPGATHVGMYIGDGKLVHASDYGIPVQVVSVDSMPWYGAARY